MEAETTRPRKVEATVEAVEVPGDAWFTLGSSVSGQNETKLSQGSQSQDHEDQVNHSEISIFPNFTLGVWQCKGSGNCGMILTNHHIAVL